MSVQSRTSHFGFAKITPNSTGWAGDVNTNMDLVDAVLHKYVAIANVRGIFTNSTLVSVGDVYIDSTTATMYEVLISYTTHSSNTFAQDRAANPTKWAEVTTFDATI